MTLYFLNNNNAWLEQYGHGKLENIECIVSINWDFIIGKKSVFIFSD